MSRQMERQDKLARFRGATALLLDVLGEDDEAEGVLDEVAGSVGELVAGDIALVVPRAEVVRADAVANDGNAKALVLT